MKETGLTGKRRLTTIAATPDDGKSQRKRRRVIPSNAKLTNYRSKIMASKLKAFKEAAVKLSRA